MITIVKELENGKKDTFTLKDSVDPETLRKIGESFPKTLGRKKKISEGKIMASIWTEKRVKGDEIVDVVFIKFTKLT